MAASSSSSPIDFQGNQCSEMQIDARFSTSRIHPHLMSFMNINPSLVDDVPIPNSTIRDLRKELKLKSPLPPRQYKWNPHDKSRIGLTLDQAIQLELKHGRRVDPNKDMKTLRRTISNRLSAQRSRMKRLEHIDELENRLKYLEVLTSGLRPKVEVYKEKKRMLEEEKVYLIAAVESRTTESINNEYKIEERRREIESLKKGLEEIIEEDDEAEPKPKPYSMEFYQQRLMQMEMSEFLIPAEEELVMEEVEVEVEVDEYLNFDGGVVQ